MGRVRDPPYLADVGRLDEVHRELSDLVEAASLAGPQDEAVGGVGEDAVGEAEDVPGLEGLALLPPQLQVHRRRVVRRQPQARAPSSPRRRRLLQQDHLRVHVVLGRRLYVPHPRRHHHPPEKERERKTGDGEGSGAGQGDKGLGADTGVGGDGADRGAALLGLQADAILPAPRDQGRSRRQVIVRARNLGAAANFIPPKSFRARRAYFTNEENGLVFVPNGQAQNAQAQMFSDPNMAMDMMEKEPFYDHSPDYYFRLGQLFLRWVCCSNG